MGRRLGAGTLSQAGDLNNSLLLSAHAENRSKGAKIWRRHEVEFSDVADTMWIGLAGT